MKKLASGLALVMCATVAMAQDDAAQQDIQNVIDQAKAQQRGQQMSPEEKAEWLDKRLRKRQKKMGLSDAQVAEWKEIKMRGGSHEEVREILTAEQQVQFDEAREKRQAHKKLAAQKQSVPGTAPAE